MVALFAQQSNIVEFPQKSNEWYTPARYIEAAREVMGGIDLDPASCELANRVVKAKQYYAMKDDGLIQPLYGNVWCNPPYGKVDNQSVMGMFVKRIINAYKMGDVTQAIILTIVRTDSRWFQRLWEYTLCFTDHYIEFNHPELIRAKHDHGTVFAYLGSHEQKFIDIFSQFGTVARRVSTPKVQPANLSLWKEEIL